MRILVVEDEKKISDLLKTALKNEFFAVDIASDGEEGSYFARTNDYDAVILDYMLPKKNGLEVCKEIRATGNTVPIIMLSVESETDIKIDLLNAGADDYLTKPFSVDELLARIRALLRRPSPIQEEIIKVGDLVINSLNNSVKLADKEIKLTRKEFMLLEYLARNQGIVLSRGMIMEHVWNMSVDPFSNTIESHILSLRKKIKSKGKTKFIHTISGKGYKFLLE